MRVSLCVCMCVSVFAMTHRCSLVLVSCIWVITAGFSYACIGASVLSFWTVLLTNFRWYHDWRPQYSYYYWVLLYRFFKSVILMRSWWLNFSSLTERSHIIIVTDLKLGSTILIEFLKTFWCICLFFVSSFYELFFCSKLLNSLFFWWFF